MKGGLKKSEKEYDDEPYKAVQEEANNLEK